MRSWPASLRLGLALVAAAAIVYALDQAVWSRAAAAATMANLEPRRDTPRAPLPFRLRSVAGPVLLTLLPAMVPAEVAPVVTLQADGRAELTRPPFSVAPGVAVPAYAAAVVLPAALPELTPAVRSTLLDVLQQLVVERPAPVTGVAVMAGAGSADDVLRLLSWLP